MVDMLQFCLIESLNVIFFDSLPLKESLTMVKVYMCKRELNTRFCL